MVTGSVPGVKWPGSGVDHPPPSSTEVKERTELYLYSPSGPSWTLLGRTLPLAQLLLVSSGHAVRVMGISKELLTYLLICLLTYLLAYLLTYLLT